MDKNLKPFTDYLLREKNYSILTVSAYEKDLIEFCGFLSEKSSNFDLSKVTYSDIRSWIVCMSDKGLSNSSINRKVSSLKAFYKFLLKTKQIEFSPLLKHRSLKTSKKIQIPFSEMELLDLTETHFNSDFVGLRDKLIFELFYATGMRRAELINLKRQDVDLSLNVIKILGKRNKERIVPIVNSVSALITDYLKLRNQVSDLDSDRFFINENGQNLNESFVYRLINGYLSNVTNKIKKSPHVVRHSFATHLINNGADLNSVKELLGHSSLASTQIYVNSSLQELQKVYGKAHPRNKK